MTNLKQKILDAAVHRLDIGDEPLDDEDDDDSYLCVRLKDALAILAESEQFVTQVQSIFPHTEGCDLDTTLDGLQAELDAHVEILHQRNDLEKRLAESEQENARLRDQRNEVIKDYTKAVDEIVELRKQLAEAQQSRWQPIGSAPKDGTAVLLWWIAPVGKPGVVFARWGCFTHRHLSIRHNCPNEPECEMRWDAYVGDMTHWQPLPAPPEPSACPTCHVIGGHTYGCKDSPFQSPLGTYQPDPPEPSEVK